MKLKGNIEKGQPGYVAARKRQYLIWSILEFGVVIALVILGYVQTGSKLNLLTVVAVVGCLPASKMLAEFLTLLPHKSIEDEKYQEIEEKSSLLTRVYDMVLTGQDKVMPIDAMVIFGHTICGYASNPKTDEAIAAQYIKEMLQKNQIEKVTVKIFHDYTAFLSRAEGMNNIAAVEHADTRRQERKMKKLILTTAM